MYFVFVLLTTVMLPVASIAIETLAHPGADAMLLVGKWFVFWAVGIRLLTAGISQALRPSLTASGILGIQDPSAEKIVAELGYANISMGLVGVLSLLMPAFVLPMAIAGGLFLGLAGIKHVMNAKRNAKENLAMTTDLFVAAAIAIYLFALFTR